MDILSIIITVAGCIAALIVLYAVVVCVIALFAKRAFNKTANNFFTGRY